MILSLQETGQGVVRLVPEGGTHEVGPEPARADRDHGEPDILVPRRDECLESEGPRVRDAPYLEKNRADFKDMTVVVRGQLSGLHRKIIAALITIDVHARDIVEELYDAARSSTNDFKWQMQLRYYWNDDDDVCAVRQTNSRSSTRTSTST